MHVIFSVCRLVLSIFYLLSFHRTMLFCDCDQYSKFELGWKIFFCFTTLIVLFLPMEGFLIKLCCVPVSSWSFEQKWVLGLLVCLLFFNDPFFAAQVITYTLYSHDTVRLCLCFLSCSCTQSMRMVLPFYI